MSRTSEIMLESIINNAKTWHRSRQRGAFTFKRDAGTEKSMPIKVRREHDDLFAQQRADADDSMRRFYEERVLKYGGSLKDLPWDQVDAGAS